MRTVRATFGNRNKEFSMRKFIVCYCSSVLPDPSLNVFLQVDKICVSKIIKNKM